MVFGFWFAFLLFFFVVVRVFLIGEIFGGRNGGRGKDESGRDRGG